MMYKLHDEIAHKTLIFDTFDHDEKTIQSWLGLTEPLVPEDKTAMLGLSDSLKRQDAEAYDHASVLEVTITAA